jgi:hypothetical protein
LTGEERFRLIAAANDRGDAAEADRLASAAKRRHFSEPDHMPFAQAFRDLYLLTFLELVDAAAFYDDTVTHWLEDRDTFGDDQADRDVTISRTRRQRKKARGDGLGWEDRSKIVMRAYRISLAAGYMLLTKAAGWKLFCERLNVAPFPLWQHFPGYDRLKSAMERAEQTDPIPSAFKPDEFLRWLNEIRPDGNPELAENPMTAERLADSFAGGFKRLAEWCGADASNPT